MHNKYLLLCAALSITACSKQHHELNSASERLSAPATVATEETPGLAVADAAIETGEAKVNEATQGQTAADPSPGAADRVVDTSAPNEKDILEDRDGQWAVTARASSTYAQTPGDKAGYSAWQATGAPNVSRYSDSAQSWASQSGDRKDPEWLEVGFANPVAARAIRIRQSLSPGVISLVELIDEAGTAHEVWSGVDDATYRKNEIEWFVREFPATDYRVKAARVTLMTARVWGWNEIDAVQLVAAK